jgi:Fic-DOC domain mobile mystery protein B
MNEWDLKPGETPVDPSDLRDKTIRNRRQLDAVEAANILRAFEKYATARLRGSKAFSYDWLLRIHKDMFCDVWTFAGRTRQVELNIGVAPHLIMQNLGALVLDMRAWPNDGAELLNQAVMLHHRAVHIHPFKNGNGRWSRFIANLWLRRHEKPAIDWPEPQMAATESEIREEYIRAIQLADTFDYSALTELHARFWSAPAT